MRNVSSLPMRLGANEKSFDLMQIFIKKEEDPDNAWISTATITLMDEKNPTLGNCQLDIFY